MLFSISLLTFQGYWLFYDLISTFYFLVFVCCLGLFDGHSRGGFQNFKRFKVSKMLFRFLFNIRVQIEDTDIATISLSKKGIK